MGVGTEDVLSTCVRFSRLLSEAHEPGALLTLLADVAVDQLNADGASVLQVAAEGQLEVVATRGIPAGLCSGQALAAELIGQELEQLLMERCGVQFAEAYTAPLVGGRCLYGVLVVFFRTPVEYTAEYGRLVQALADMAGVALDQAFYRETLERKVDELRASQEVLTRVEKLRALGEMAAGVAHDLRNIFHPLLLQLEALRRRAHEPAQVFKAAELLERVARRGVETVERLRLFGQPALEAEAVDLDTLLDEAVALFQPRLERAGGRIRLEVVRGGPLRARVCSAELVTALVNLLLNAQEAMPHGGRLSVRSGRSAEGRGWLQVQDTGEGMPPHVRERLFEPFFTTKGRAGTGLGLAMVYTFVQRSGGELRLDTAPGQGTTFTLHFPLLPEPPGASHPRL